MGQFRITAVFSMRSSTIRSIALVLATAPTFLIIGCESDTDALRRTFAKMTKQLETDANVAASLYDEKRLIEPLALRFGEANCRHILIKLDSVPYNLRHDRNKLDLPYSAELRGTATVMPCGHKIPYSDPFMMATDKHQWVPLVTGETIVAAIRAQIEQDAANRSTIRQNPYEPTP